METLTVSRVILSNVRQKIPEFMVLLKVNVTHAYIKTHIIMLAINVLSTNGYGRGKSYNATL
jgi:hypothetical protein